MFVSWTDSHNTRPKFSQKRLRLVLRAVPFAAGYLILQAFLLSGLISAQKEKSYDLSDLEGAWWSDLENPTADFAIIGNEIWLDSDSSLRSCIVVDGDTLVYDLGPGVGEVRRRIVSLKNNELVLEDLLEDQGVRTTHEEFGSTQVRSELFLCSLRV